MPKQYGREFRLSICERRVAGEQVSKFSEESGVSPATLWTMRLKQSLVSPDVAGGAVLPRFQEVQPRPQT